MLQTAGKINVRAEGARGDFFTSWQMTCITLRYRDSFHSGRFN